MLLTDSSINIKLFSQTAIKSAISIFWYVVAVVDQREDREDQVLRLRAGGGTVPLRGGGCGRGHADVYPPQVLLLGEEREGVGENLMPLIITFFLSR